MQQKCSGTIIISSKYMDIGLQLREIAGAVILSIKTQRS
jgi:hypothetical protein